MVFGREVHPVVVPGDPHSSVLALHRRQKGRQPHRWIRRVIPEVAAVHRRLRTVHGQRRLREPPVPEDDGGATGGMEGTVEDDERIGVEQPSVRGDDAGQARRGDLLLAVEDDLDADRRLPAFSRQDVHRGEEHLDWRLVVRGGPGEYAQLRIERRRQQLLTVDLADARGIDPDVIRRDDERWVSARAAYR